MKPAILLVRPPARLAADLAVCEAAGWQGVAFSVMRIEPLPDREKVLAAVFQTASAVFWVSPSAVETALPFLGEAARRLPHIAVGQATAAALRRAGCLDVSSPEAGNDSEAAAAVPRWNALPEGATIAVVRGEGGRDWLARRLEQRGFKVGFAEIYRRVPQMPDWAVFQTADVRAVWITSREMVQMLFESAPAGMVQKLQSLIYFTHHPRIAAALSAAGVTQIETVKALDSLILNRYTEKRR